MLSEVLSYENILSSAQELALAYAVIHQAQKQGTYLSHLPRIYAVYQLKDELVVVMEYLRGETLQDAVLRCGPSFQLAQETFPQVCEAVRELHEYFNPPLIHRDLKPANIVLSNGRVFLIDFGIARVYRSGSASDTSHLGTRAYAPPEQYGFRANRHTKRCICFRHGPVLLLDWTYR